MRKKGTDSERKHKMIYDDYLSLIKQDPDAKYKCKKKYYEELSYKYFLSWERIARIINGQIKLEYRGYHKREHQA